MRPRLSASCLLFDMDGTLIDATKLIERIWISWCRRHEIGPEQLLSESRGQRIVDTVRKYAPNADLMLKSNGSPVRLTKSRQV